MRKIRKLSRAINDSFREHLHAALAKEFPALKVETTFNLMSMQMITTPVGKKKFTKREHDFIRIYDDGYFTAKAQVIE